MARKEFDLSFHRKNALIEFKQKLGKPILPSWETQYAYWKKRVDTLTPRGFLYVFDITEDRTILSSGLSSIGYKDDQSLTSFDLIAMVHENHRLLLSCQVYRIHQTLMEFKYDEIGLDYYSAGFRAIKDMNGKYWLTYYTSESFQYDESGTQVRHLTWCHILSPYRGEPLYIEFFHRDGKTHHALLKRINTKLRNIKIEQLEWLGFRIEDRELIKFYDSGIPKEEICKLLGNISPRTLEGRNRKILKIGKEAFPINNFSTYMDVIKYLEKMDLLP